MIKEDHITNRLTAKLPTDDDLGDVKNLGDHHDSVLTADCLKPKKMSSTDDSLSLNALGWISLVLPRRLATVLTSNTDYLKVFKDSTIHRTSSAVMDSWDLRTTQWFRSLSVW